MIGLFGNGQLQNINFGSGDAQITNFVAGNIIVCVGDPSSHGGTVANSGGNTEVYCNGVLVAVQGAIHNCPIPLHGNTAITTIITERFINGKLILVYGSQAGCGAVIQPPSSRAVVLNQSGGGGGSSSSSLTSSSSSSSSSAASLPTVNLINPVTGNEFATGAAIPLVATASETGGTITQVTFFVGVSLIATVYSGPTTFTYNWAQNLPVGTYVLIAQATDAHGNVATSNQVTITIFHIVLF